MILLLKQFNVRPSCGQQY